MKKLSYNKIGSVVMNCNPYTNGHKPLILQASKFVDFLYVFIVQEDKSFFSFSDRLKVVHEDLCNIECIKIVPSGNMMISQETLPQYFEKEDIKDVTLDYSLDLSIFCKYIVPSLGITHRFAGTEPFDQLTRQYNDAMRLLLPKYGLNFIEIDRFKLKNEPISASLVRRLLKNGNVVDIAKLVPSSTLKLLIQNSLVKHASQDSVLKNGVDEDWYNQQYPDVKSFNIDPVFHYFKYGYKENRNPTSWFDTSFYLSAYPDVANSLINPFIHYLTCGINEFRKPNPSW